MSPLIRATAQVFVAALTRSIALQAFLLHSGPIKRYKEAAREAGLAHAFADAASSPGTSLDGCINLVASLTLLGDFDVPLIHATVRRAVPELDQMKPDRIAALCYTLGTAGYSNYAFLKAVENTMQRRKDDFNMLSLAKVVWMLGRVHYNNEQVAGLVEYLIGRALLCESPQVSPHQGHQGHQGLLFKHLGDHPGITLFSGSWVADEAPLRSSWRVTICCSRRLNSDV